MFHARITCAVNTPGGINCYFKTLGEGEFPLPLWFILFIKLELVGKLFPALLVLSLEVAEQAAAVAYHLQESAAGVVVLLVLLQVLGDLLDFLSQDCYLYFRGTGVVLMHLELLDEALFFLGR